MNRTTFAAVLPLLAVLALTLPGKGLAGRRRECRGRWSGLIRG